MDKIHISGSVDLNTKLLLIKRMIILTAMYATETRSFTEAVSNQLDVFQKKL